MFIYYLVSNLHLFCLFLSIAASATLHIFVDASVVVNENRFYVALFYTRRGQTMARGPICDPLKLFNPAGRTCRNDIDSQSVIQLLLLRYPPLATVAKSWPPAGLLCSCCSFFLHCDCSVWLFYRISAQQRHLHI